jgi:hypothetical protein
MSPQPPMWSLLKLTETKPLTLLFQSRLLLKLISRSSVGLGESTQYERYDVLV